MIPKGIAQYTTFNTDEPFAYKIDFTKKLTIKFDGEHEFMRVKVMAICILIQEMCEYDLKKPVNILSKCSTPDNVAKRAHVFFSEYHKVAIHNDIKLDNIVCCQGNIKFIDFGTSQDLSELTIDKISSGTPLYFSYYKVLRNFPGLSTESFESALTNNGIDILIIQATRESNKSYVTMTKCILEPNSTEKYHKYFLKKSDEHAFFITLLLYTFMTRIKNNSI